MNITSVIPASPAAFNRPARQTSLEWDEHIGLFVGEWAPGSGRRWRITVSPDTMRAHLGARTRSGISRDEALSISAWIESHTLCRQVTGESLPGVNVIEVL